MVSLLGALLGLSAAHAEVLDERDFWSRLQQTNVLLQTAISDSTRRADVTLKVRDLWHSLDSVRSADGSTFAVDVRWLTAVDGSEAGLRTLQAHVQALIDYHNSHDGRSTAARSALAALAQVLKDPRFQYPDVTPTRIPSPTPSNEPTQSPSFISPALGQAILIAVGVLAVIVLLFNIAQGIRTRQVEMNTDEVIDDDPTTSTAAIDKAADSEAVQDYRKAIRYMYISSLLLLDERGLIHYDRTLTNREHLRMISTNPVLSDALRPVVNTFDRVWYGFAPVDEAMYAEFRRDVERLRQITP